MRRIAIVAGAVLALLLALGVVWLQTPGGQLAVALSMRTKLPKTALLRNLAGESWEANSEDFTRRLRAKFPAGTTEAALIAGLAHEGFKLQPDASPFQQGAPKRRAAMTWPQGPCDMLAEASWRVDSAGKAVDLAGFYHEIGCP